MTNPPSNTKRFRLRFSVRTLVVVVTLVCCYFGLWEVTRTCGIRVIPEHDFREVTSPCPFVIVDSGPSIRVRTNLNVVEEERRRHYYFWCFGYVAKLPYKWVPPFRPPEGDHFFIPTNRPPAGALPTVAVDLGVPANPLGIIQTLETLDGRVYVIRKDEDGNYRFHEWPPPTE